jgi:hypothetical protein
MERIIITIETTNAAFAENSATEVARILRRLAEEFEVMGEPAGTLQDINWNDCGTVRVK